MSNENIPYRIEQTSNKHSRAVYRNDTIVIRLAKNLNTKQRSEHIDELLKRMKIQVLKSEKRNVIDPFRPLLEGHSSCTVQTNIYAHSIFLTPAKKTSVRFEGNDWHISISPRINGKQLEKLLWKTASNAYKEDMLNMTQRINAELLKVHMQNVRLKLFSSQWGSCSPQGIISLNTALLFVPLHLLEYVIIHELAHRKHANHSARYWKCVENVLPSYNQDRKELRQFALPSQRK